MFVLALIIGLALGIGITLAILGRALDKSNNLGDEKPKITDFSNRGFVMVVKQDKVRSDTKLDIPIPRSRN